MAGYPIYNWALYNPSISCLWYFKCEYEFDRISNSCNHFITGVINVFTAKKSSTRKENTNLVFALFFGLIHGLGFSNYFKMMIGNEEDKLIPLLEFALGIEAAQIIIVLGILIVGTLLQNFFRVTRRDWILVCSSIVIGFAIQMMLERIFW